MDSSPPPSVSLQVTVSATPSLHAPSLSPSYSSPPILPAPLPTDIPVFESEAGVDAVSSVSPVVEGSAVTLSDITSGDQQRDQFSAADGIEDRRGDNGKEDGFGADTPELCHRELEKLIGDHLKKLRRNKTLLSDTKAASTALDLEAMCRFNDIRLSLHIEIRKQKERIANAPAHHRAIMKRKQKKIRPAIQASTQVANLLSRTETYARRLREAAHYLSRTGELLENNQGKGGAHATLLNRPEIASGVRRFVNGDIPIEEGGFGERVSSLVSHGQFANNEYPRARCGHTSCADMSICFFCLRYSLRIRSVTLLPFVGCQNLDSN
jgi:hypothetical protein